MLSSHTFRETLEKWRHAKVGKIMTPVYVPKKIFKQIGVTEPKIFCDDVDCTQSPAQEVPIGYNPTELEISERDVLTAIRRLWPELDNGPQPNEIFAQSIVREGTELINIREDPETNSVTGQDDVASSWSLYTTIMDMDLETIFNEVLHSDAVASQNVEATVQAVIAEAEDNLEEQVEAGELVLTRSQEPVPDTWSCTVCWEAKSPCEFPSRTPSEMCDHPVTLCCKSCLEQAIVISSKTRYWYDIRCPVCGTLLEYEDVKEFAPKELFEEFDKFMLVHYLQSTPTFRFCTSPDCDFGQIHHSVNPCSDELASRIVCSLCSCISCSKHDLPWHEGETCEEFDTRVSFQNRVQDRKSKKKVDKVTKACPKPDCGHRIDKDGGCQHMTCLCRHEFCWDCLAAWPDHKWTCIDKIRSYTLLRIVRPGFAGRLRGYLRDIRSRRSRTL